MGSDAFDHSDIARGASSDSIKIIGGNVFLFYKCAADPDVYKRQIPGSAFGACGEGFIRIAYTCSDENLHEALRRIDAFCKSL